MNWLNLSVSDLSSDNFISASMEQRGAWIGLLRYCMVQENGGFILKCMAWTDMQWMQACGVTTAIVKAHCTLWNWNGDELRIWAYPYEMEQALKKKRSIGKRFAEKRWEKEVEAKAKRPRKYTLKPRIQSTPNLKVI